MTGALLALASAATFGLNNASIRRGVLSGSVLHAMAITVTLGVPLFAAACLIMGSYASLGAYSEAAWFWLSLAGIVHFVIGRYGNYAATQALGSALSSPLQQLSIPVSLLLALIFLDESLSPLKLTGFALVMTGPAIAMRARPKHANATEFRPEYRRGLLWGGVCALGYGTSPLFIVLGLGGDRSVENSIAGGLVSYGAAAAVVVVLVAFAGGTHFLRGLDRGAGRWFLLSGVLVFLSQMFRYMALAVAPVTVVVPIQRLSVVFRVLFSYVLNPRHEVLSGRVLLGIGLSLLGAIALALSSEAVQAMLPYDWVRLLTVRWP